METRNLQVTSEQIDKAKNNCPSISENGMDENKAIDQHLLCSNSCHDSDEDRSCSKIHIVVIEDVSSCCNEYLHFTFVF